MSKAVIWSKDNCPFCVKAKTLLMLNGIDYEERIIGKGYTKEDLLEAIPTARSVPQVFVDDAHVGGYTELKEMLGDSDDYT